MGANSSRPDDLIGPDIDPVGDHDDLMSMSTESADSGVSLKSDQSKAGMILFEDSSPLSRLYFLSFEEDVVSDDEDLVESPDDLMATGNRLSIESFDSGVSFKSNWSKDGLIDFKEGVSPSRLDLSSFEKKHDVADDGLVESPDDQEEMNQELSSEVGWKHG